MKIFDVVGCFSIFAIPALSIAKTAAITDSELESVYGQWGSVEITFNDISVKDKILRTTSTDGLDFWNPGWNSALDLANWKCQGDICHSDYILNASRTVSNSDYENNMEGMGYIWAEYPDKGYFGYTARISGGKIKRSGSMTLEVFTPESDPTDFFTTHTNIAGDCRIAVYMDQQKIDAKIGIEMIVKLSPNQDLSGGGVLGRTYTSGVSMTNNGNLTVYARNNSRAVF